MNELGNVGDPLFTQGKLDQEHLRRWAKEQGVLSELDGTLAQST